MKKVLIIEDDMLITRIYRQGYEAAGYQVATAQDGEQGLKALREFKPDVLQLDLMIPKVNGVEVIKKIRYDADLKGIPIIVISNCYIPDLVREAWKAGATKVISKLNCSPKLVLELIAGLVAKPQDSVSALVQIQQTAAAAAARAAAAKAATETKPEPVKEAAKDDSIVFDDEGRVVEPEPSKVVETKKPAKPGLIPFKEAASTLAPAKSPAPEPVAPAPAAPPAASPVAEPSPAATISGPSAGEISMAKPATPPAAPAAADSGDAPTPPLPPAPAVPAPAAPITPPTTPNSTGFFFKSASVSGSVLGASPGTSPGIWTAPTPAPVSGVSTGANVPSNTDAAQQQMRQEFVSRAPQIQAELRARLLALVRNTDVQSQINTLRDLYWSIHSLVGYAGMMGYVRLSHIADALEVLLKELYSKPKKITPSTLRTIALAMDCLSQLFNPDADEPDEISRSVLIMVVDDDAISRRTLGSALEKADLKAVMLDRAALALSVLEDNEFDLIFLDVDMPGMDGFELCKRIRTMPNNRHTPVVFVTGLGDFESRARSSLSGGNDLIAKPYPLIELTLKALIFLVKGRQGTGQPAPQPGNSQ